MDYNFRKGFPTANLTLLVNAMVLFTLTSASIVLVRSVLPISGAGIGARINEQLLPQSSQFRVLMSQPISLSGRNGWAQEQPTFALTKFQLIILGHL